MSTDGDSTLSNTIDKLVPVTSDGIPIIWTDDNDAHIEGLLHEVGKFYRRTGRFQYFFKHHAAALPNGKLAVEDLQSAYIMSEKIKDDYSFEKPCPPTAQRVAPLANEHVISTLEVVYCYLPTGYTELDSNGQPLIARVDNPASCPPPSAHALRVASQTEVYCTFFL